MSSEPPQILSYAVTASRPSGRQSLLRTCLFLLGMAGGVVGIAFLGMWLWSISGYDFYHAPHPKPTWPAIVFFVLLVAAFSTGVLVFRRFRRAVKWLLMGLFIAAGFASLAEGFCFLKQ